MYFIQIRCKPLVAAVLLLFESLYIIESIFQNGFSVNYDLYVFAYLPVANLFCMRGKAGIVTNYFVSFIKENFKQIQIQREQDKKLSCTHHFNGCQVGSLVLYIFPTSPYFDYFETNPRYDIMFNSLILSYLISWPHCLFSEE